MLEVYRDASNQWRWRLVAANGKIIAESGEAYVKRSAVVKAIERVKTLIGTARVVEHLG